jgi:hypothetical protein
MKHLLLTFILSYIPTLVIADWTLVKKYGEENNPQGLFNVYIDYSQIKGNNNLFVPVLLNRSKANHAGVISDKHLFEVDCRSKKLASIESGSFTGPMATGNPPSTPMDSILGPMKYGKVPFVEWLDVNDKSALLVQDIFNYSCNKRN